ncbi:formin-like protein 5 [Canna indica]|uniref:Formin-like protein 5 n=1 Tax=Canna indica TaxID=4628 RepID=A0AAQ3K5R5_9LILI|nr:formin-like protein 5 [Canna indica]
MDPSLAPPEPHAPTPATSAAQVPVAPTEAVPAATELMLTPASVAVPPPAHHPPNPYIYHAQPQPVQPQHFPPPGGYVPYHYSNPNPNPNPNPYPNLNSETSGQSDARVGHLGFPADPYASGLYAQPHGHGAALHPAHYSFPGGRAQAVVPAQYPYPGGEVPAASHGVQLYYGGHGGSERLGFVVEHVINPYDGHPLGYGAGLPRPYIAPKPPIPFHRKASHGKNKAKHSTSKKSTKKKVSPVQKWTTKVVQSAYCEACQVKCDTQEVLQIHKQGKKHKKNMQKLQDSITAKPKVAPVTSVVENVIIAPVIENKPPAEEEKVFGIQKRKKDATSGDLEEKKRKVLQGGAAAGEVKVCVLCNVVVNSQKVYDYHIAGQKHATMVKKQQEKVAV